MLVLYIFVYAVIHFIYLSSLRICASGLHKWLSVTILYHKSSSHDDMHTFGSVLSSLPVDQQDLVFLVLFSEANSYIPVCQPGTLKRHT